MVSNYKNLTSAIMKHLIDIAAGRFDLKDSIILNEKDEALQEILMGLLHLQEEIVFKKEELEKAIRLPLERESKYRQIFDASPISILELKLSTCRVDNIYQLIESLQTKLSVRGVNQSGISLFEAASEEDFLLHSKDFLKIHAESAMRLAPEMIDQSTTWETEAVLTKANGKSIPILVRSTPFDKDAEGSIAILTIIDISELKNLQSQFLQAQKMNSIGRLAGGVAHDFNNLLTVINGYAHTLASDESDPGRLEKMTIISDTGNRAAQLTKQLLAFSRQEIMSPRILNINKVISDMEKMLRRLIDESIALRFRPAADAGQINMDQGQLEQIILNLVVNASDAMKTGGEITIETANQELSKSQIEGRFDATIGSFVMLAVSDTGIGMNDEVMENIFEPFFTTKKVGRGTGLGLSTVHGIVKQNKGNIWVDSEPGRGTTFKLYFPRVTAPNLEKMNATVAKPVPRSSETILVVEDDQAVRKLIAEILLGHGHTVLEAADGVEALKLLSEVDNPIDLILSDVVMPNMGGRELWDNVRNTHSKVHFLFMSGHTTNAIVRHGVLETGLSFLQKPFLPGQLLRATRQALDSQDGNRRDK